MTAAGSGRRGAATAVRPVLTRGRAELATALAAVREPGAPLALVPTMGALHAGHRVLLRRAAAAGAPVAVSVFVNPLQFGPAEDLDRYPRTLSADLAMCAEEGVSVVFAPARDVMYPAAAPQVTVHSGPLGAELEGASRPGHFDGVLTVVAKLFGLIRPSTAVFGEKDYQQLTLIRQLVTDLELGVQIIGLPTVREPDGLALSSRNSYLSTAERAAAAAIPAALRAGVAAADGGAAAVLAAARGLLDTAPGIRPDYLALRSPDLGPAPSTGDARLLVAARVGPTRLIDNLPLVLAGGPDS